jgi:hypothetical protein
LKASTSVYPGRRDGQVWVTVIVTVVGFGTPGIEKVGMDTTPSVYAPVVVSTVAVNVGPHRTGG